MPLPIYTAEELTALEGVIIQALERGYTLPEIGDMIHVGIIMGLGSVERHVAGVHKHEDKEGNQQDADDAGGAVAPAAAVRPGGEGAEEE